MIRPVSHADTLREIMNAFDTISERVRLAHPEASEAERFEIAAAVMDRACLTDPRRVAALVAKAEGMA